MYGKIFLLFLLFIWNIPAPGKTQETYFRPDFHSGHNLSLLLSGEYTTWNVSQNTGNAVSQESVSAVNQSHFVPAVFLKYAYHFHVVSGFGLFLGSTLGVLASSGQYDHFYPGYAISFPTINIGLIQNFHDHLRLFLSGEYGATWYPKMTITTNSGTVNSLSAVPNVFSYSLGSDFILDNRTMVTVQFGGRSFSVPCLNSCNNSNYINSLNIRGSSLFAQTGLTWSFN